MKRLSLLVLAAALTLMVACEGDNPSGSGGTLDTVTGFAIDWTTTAGVDVVMNWTAVTDAEGYYVWFKADGAGEWVQVGDVATTTFTHTATSAGTYTVTAYAGEDTSEGYATEQSTMPIVISESYSIYDNYAPAEYPSGFIFGSTGGEAGLASSGGFVQDIYAYDPQQNPTYTELYSGDVEPFGDGLHTEMYALTSGDNPGAPPASGWWTTGYVVTGDVIYGLLADDYFVKMYINDVYGPVGGSANGTGIDFTYEWQDHAGVRLFTTNI